MSPLSADEIQKLAFELKTSEGHRLQEVRISQSLVALGFYSEALYWLIVDLDSKAPQVIHLKDLNVIRFQAEKKPVQLYLKAHFLGLRLAEVTAPRDLGRVLILDFQNGKSIEIRLFPKGQNLLVRSGKTTVSIFKPKLLRESEVVSSGEMMVTEVLKLKSEEWLVKRNKNHKSDKPPEKSLEFEINKKTEKIKKAIFKITEDMNEKLSLSWQDVGEWMKTHQTMAVPEEFAGYLDLKKSFSENLEMCFRKSKEVKIKILGAKKRIDELQAELQNKESWFLPANMKNKSSPLTLAHAKGRTFSLGDNIILFVGKSAQDNLRLLRQAKPWFYWLHLRDRSSCHGLIQRNKNQVLSEVGLHLAAHHLIANNFGEKQKNHWGDKFDLIVTECRFVRPIKGDRHGRVHFSDERTFTHLFKA